MTPIIKEAFEFYAVELESRNGRIKEFTLAAKDKEEVRQICREQYPRDTVIKITLLP